MSTLVFASAVLAHAHAAELGEARVTSHIGQQLVADIELTMIDNPAAQVAVRVASPEVYQGAGIALPPVLPSLNLTVMRRDGRQFLHVTSLRPLDADHLHLYLELTDKGQRAVRLTTLWLTPDPNPAPPAPAPVSVSAPVPVPVPVQAPVKTSVPAPVAMPTPRPALVPAPVRVRTTPAPAHAEPPVPDAPPPAASGAKPVSQRVAQPVVQPFPQPAQPAQPAQPPAERKKPLLLLPIHKPALPAVLAATTPPAACTPGEAQACSALGAKNAALREQLSKLENQVKGLQKALGVTPTPAGAAEPHKAAEVPKAKAPKAPKGQAEAHAPGGSRANEHKADANMVGEHEAGAPKASEHKADQHKADEAKPEAAPADAKPPAAEPPPPPAPKPISAIKPLVIRKPKAPPPEEGGAPWGWIGGGVLLAAAGGGAVALRRRVARRKAAASLAPVDAGAPQNVVEPTME